MQVNMHTRPADISVDVDEFPDFVTLDLAQGSEKIVVFLSDPELAERIARAAELAGRLLRDQRRERMIAELTVTPATSSEVTL